MRYKIYFVVRSEGFIRFMIKFGRLVKVIVFFNFWKFYEKIGWGN